MGTKTPPAADLDHDGGPGETVPVGQTPPYEPTRNLPGIEPAYTFAEVAQHLRTTVAAVRRMIAEKTLKAIMLKPGKRTCRHLRVRASDLQAMLNKAAEYNGCPTHRPAGNR